ncbi:MAG: hypothetical protein HUU41_02430 [Bryobacteraceae bacterium]|nr:hypothetical protein [Bryobacterales bacterium]MEB2363638.1 hypothetical protein [Bryobacterales bacterium]NUM99946.1 hypothetical protein [Bryobacteraceae bacterium]
MPHLRVLLPFLLGFTMILPPLKAQGKNARPDWIASAVSALEKELVDKYGPSQRVRVERGLKQVAGFWRADDGGRNTFEEFVRANFAGDQKAIDTVFSRYETLFEQLDGHMLEIQIAFRLQVDLDRGPIMPYDEVFAAYDPAAHAKEDFFKSKLAFVVLLNFPLTTLEERLARGEQWSRREWAEARLAQRFSRRVPPEVNLAIAEAGAQAEQYIAQYNIWMHHLLDEKGKRLFPAKMRLLSHWNLRDQIKADYTEKDGLPRQRMIARVMEHIVRQTIPQAVVNNPTVDWNLSWNSVSRSEVKDYSEAPRPVRQASNDREPDTRYAMLLGTFRALRQIDPYSPAAPTHIARVFDEERELPEERVQAMFEQILTSPLIPRVAKLIEQRLGRPLEPFDIWYAGFKPRGKYSEAELDEITRKRYPTPEAYEKDMPRMFRDLGFSAERADYLASNIVVQPARGSGHAWGAQLRTAPARLRTRVGADGMDYKGYNIAVHEMGHNVEQTFSLKKIDHWLLNGVPNTAFTEALAFVFQARDLQLLGLQDTDESAEALRILNDFWATYEIAGVALVDMAVWHWMYDQPDATPAQLREAVIQIATDVWNRHYAPVFRHKDVVLLGIYSHMIERYLYLPDYPIGHLIAHQLEEHMAKAGKIGPEVERVSKQGRIAPDLWMKGATGAPVGAEALIEAATRALARIVPSN